MIEKQHPRGTILLWIDGAGHHSSDEVEEWLEGHRCIRVINFAAYTLEENPQEGVWKQLKDEADHHRWQATFADLSKAIDHS
jgi:hypothetical protein